MRHPLACLLAWPSLHATPSPSIPCIHYGRGQWTIVGLGLLFNLSMTKFNWSTLSLYFLILVQYVLDHVSDGALSISRENWVCPFVYPLRSYRFFHNILYFIIHFQGILYFKESRASFFNPPTFSPFAETYLTARIHAKVRFLALII